MVSMELLMPVAAMLAFDILFALMTVLVKKALDGGLNPVVLIALRQFVAAVFLAPIAYFRERFVRKNQLLILFLDDVEHLLKLI
jgi:large subunit ribosomal protein L9e